MRVISTTVNHAITCVLICTFLGFEALWTTTLAGPERLEAIDQIKSLTVMVAALGVERGVEDRLANIPDHVTTATDVPSIILTMPSPEDPQGSGKIFGLVSDMPSDRAAKFARVFAAAYSLGYSSDAGPRQDSSAKSADAKKRMRDLGLAFMLYCEDHNGDLSPLQSEKKLKTLLSPYIESSVDFVDPVSGKPFMPVRMPKGCNFYLVKSPANTVAIRQPELQRKGKVLILLFDGNVRFSSD